MTPISLTLTCKDSTEAEIIIQALLAQRLIACAKTSAVSSTFYWHEHVEKAQEVLITMESVLEKFAEIESVVKSLHSYETFVLQAYPILKASVGVQAWIAEAVKNS